MADKMATNYGSHHDRVPNLEQSISKAKHPRRCRSKGFPEPDVENVGLKFKGGFSTESMSMTFSLKFLETNVVLKCFWNQNVRNLGILRQSILL